MNEIEVFLNLVKSPEKATPDDLPLLERKLKQYPTYNNIKLAVLHALKKTSDKKILQQTIQKFGLHFQHQESLLKYLIVTDEQQSENETVTNDGDISFIKDSPVSTNLEEKQLLDDSEKIEHEPEQFSDSEHEGTDPILSISETANDPELEKGEGGEIMDNSDVSSITTSSSEDAEEDIPVNKIDIYSINFEELKLHEFHDAQEYANNFTKQKEHVEKNEISVQHKEIEQTNSEESVSELEIDDVDEHQSIPETENKEDVNTLEAKDLEPQGGGIEEKPATETQVDESHEMQSEESVQDNENVEEPLAVEDIEENLIENAPFVEGENQDSQQLKPEKEETYRKEEEPSVEAPQEEIQSEEPEQEAVDVDQDDELEHSKDTSESKILDTEPRFSEIKFDLDIDSIESSDSEKDDDHEPLPISQKRTFKEWLNPDGSYRAHQSKEKQEKIINDFIAKNPGPIRPHFQKDFEPKQTQPTEDDFARIGNMSDLMTETLAKIYLDQKKYSKAIRAYKMLSLKYPEKSSFFASQISEIKKLRAHNGNL